MSPEVRARAPATMEINVDFPAPFSPKITWHSPAISSKSTLSKTLALDSP